MKCITETNHVLVTRVFPRFKQVACFRFEFPLVNDDVNSCFEDPSVNQFVKLASSLKITIIIIDC